MRFGFYTDIHLSGLNPRHRIDNYRQAILTKVAEVYAVAEAEGCEFMAFGGDFFNTHRVFSYEVIGDAMDVICESSLPTYGCIGEHDLYGHSPNTFPSSTLAFFVRRCPQFTLLFNPIEVETGIWLHGKHEWEAVEAINGVDREVDQKDYNVLVCHELITNERAPFSVTDTATLTDSPFDLVCSGDLHNGYEPHEVNGTWFVNPGALARRNSDHNWHPKMAVIDIEKGIPPVINLIELKTARPYDEVFGEGVAEVSLKAQEFDGHEFADELAAFEAQAVDVYELVQTVGRAKGVRKPVLDYLATKKPAEVS
jgi:DNA repair exonuclease SbcCD nuclease subunit